MSAPPAAAQAAAQTPKPAADPQQKYAMGAFFGSNPTATGSLLNAANSQRNTFLGL